MKIRDKMLPVLKPKGDEHDVHEIKKLLKVDGGVKALKL